MSPYLLQHAYNPINWFHGEKKLLLKQKKKINQSSFRSAILVAIGGKFKTRPTLTIHTDEFLIGVMNFVLVGATFNLYKTLCV